MPRRRTDGWASGSALVSQFQRQGGGGGGGGAPGTGTSAPDLPIITPVTAAEEITISHHFKNRYVTVTVYTEEGYILPPSRILEIECREYATRLVFPAPFTGVVKLAS